MLRVIRIYIDLHSRISDQSDKLNDFSRNNQQNVLVLRTHSSALNNKINAYP